MDGRDLIWESDLHNLKYKPSKNDNSVIIISSYNKIGKRLQYIKTEFPEAVITDVQDEFGYGLFEVKLK